MIDNRFKALTHYICEHCIENPIDLGIRKLNQILWNSEVAAFALLGEALTPQKYIRREFSPACVNTEKALQELQDEGKVLVRRRVHAGYPRFLILSLKEVTHPFNNSQINLVDRVIDWIVHNHVASPVRVFSENNTWKNFEIGQEVPHFAIFSTKRAEINEEDVQLTQKSSKSRKGLFLVPT